MKISVCGDGSFPAVLDQRVDQPIVYAREVVRLPVVACARREERIERLLPAGVGMRPHDVGDRLAEATQRLERALAGGHVAGVEHGQDDDLRAVHGDWQEGKWRRFPDHDPGHDVVGGLRGELAIVMQHAARLGERMHDQPRQHLRADRMELELEAGDDAEVAAAAANRPEEIGLSLPLA